MSALAAFTRLSGHQRIGGQLVGSAGGAAIDVWDPATEQRIGQIADAAATEIDRAVAVANDAQRSWRKVNHHRRAELLHEVSRQVMADRPLVAEMLTRDAAAIADATPISAWQPPSAAERVALCLHRYPIAAAASMP